MKHGPSPSTSACSASKPPCTLPRRGSGGPSPPRRADAALHYETGRHHVPVIQICKSCRPTIASRSPRSTPMTLRRWRPSSPRRRRCSAIERAGWPKSHERVDVLRRLAGLMEARRDHFSRLIAREGGKPLTDAMVETTRAIDGVRNAADELRNFAGREIPMGLTPASTGRLAFTTQGADRRGRGDLGVQPSAEPDRAPGGAGDCRRLSGDRQASCGDAAVLPRVRRAGARGGPRRAVVPDLHHRRQRTGRAARHRSARRVPELHRLGARRLVICTASSRPARAPRWSTAAWRRPSSTAAPISIALIEPMVKGGYYHAGQVCVSTQRIFVHVDDR